MISGDTPDPGKGLRPSALPDNYNVIWGVRATIQDKVIMKLFGGLGRVLIDER